MAVLTKFALFLLASFAVAGQAQAEPEYGGCLASIEQPLTVAQLQPCAAMAADAKTPDDVRAEIYFQLAVAANMRGIQTGESPEQILADTLDNADKSIALNPKNVEVYLFVLRLFPLQAIPDEIEKKYLHRGLVENPHSMRMLAAQGRYSQDEATRFAACNEAVEKGTDDFYVQMTCGHSFLVLGSYDKAISAFEKGTIKFQFAQRMVYGMMQLENPWIRIAEVYHETKRPEKAAETIKRYWNTIPPNAIGALDHFQQAEFLFDAGAFGEAAVEYRKAARPDSPFPQLQVKMKEAMALARAGDEAGAENLAEEILSQADLKTILQIQVAMKNSGRSEVMITGKSDKVTLDAMKHCLTTSSCKFSFGMENHMIP